MMKTIKAAFGSTIIALLLFGAAPASAQSWQCAPFARMFSGIDLYGNAATWWQKAVGKYLQGAAPKVGAVMVFKAVRTMRYGHVATVSKIVSDRIINVTHANWSRINGRRGQVETDVKVVDVSPRNDWSEVKVWYAPIKSVGLKAYPVSGFIYRDKHGGTPDQAAPTQTAQVTEPATAS